MTRHEAGRLKQSNKKHKGKNGKRAQIRSMGPGKTAQTAKPSLKNKGHSSAENRQDRINRNNQLKQQKREKAWLQKRLTVSKESGGAGLINRVVGIIPLSEHADERQCLAKCMDQVLAAAGNVTSTDQDVPAAGSYGGCVHSMYDCANRAELTFLVPPRHRRRDVFCALDIAKAADIILFLLVLENENSLGQLIDEVGFATIGALKASGCPDVIFCIEGLALSGTDSDSGTVFSSGSAMTCSTSAGGTKRSRSLRKAVHQFISTNAMFPGARLAPLGHSEITDEDSATDSRSIFPYRRLLRQICTFTPRTVNWRACRSYLLADAAAVQIVRRSSSSSSNGGTNEQHVLSTNNATTCSVQVTGYLRGQQPLHLHSLMHIVGVGAGRISKLWPAIPPFAPTQRGSLKADDCGAMDLDKVANDDKNTLFDIKRQPVLSADASRQDSLVLEASPDALLGEQTWPAEEEMLHADAPPLSQSIDGTGQATDRSAGRDRRALPDNQRLPAGMSSYQADWFMDEDGKVDFTSAVKDSESVNRAAAAVAGNGDIEDGDDDDDDDDGEGLGEGLDAEDFTVASAQTGTRRAKYSMCSIRASGPQATLRGSGLTADGSTLAAAQADEEFPDEMDTPHDVSARQRFARYRALQSFRSSPWHPKENLPQDYARIFQFENFAGAQKRVLAEAQSAEQMLRDSVLREMRSKSKSTSKNKKTQQSAAMDVDAAEAEAEAELESALTVAGTDNEFIKPGMFVCLELDGVDLSAVEQLRSQSGSQAGSGFLLVYALYKHEQKMSVLHCSVQRTANYTLPIKSKDDLLFQVGFRSFWTKPIFSEANLNCDKHKFERFLQNDRFSVASCFGPICVSSSPLPLLVFKQISNEAVVGAAEHGSIAGTFRDGMGSRWALVATGSLSSVDPDRIMLKKVALTGHPIRVRKKFAVLKHLFYDPLDVRWFKPAELVTKFGLRGHIKEPVGTHGLCKAVFSDVIKQNDTVMLVLYKRVFPKFHPAGLNLR